MASAASGYTSTTAARGSLGMPGSGSTTTVTKHNGTTTTTKLTVARDNVRHFPKSASSLVQKEKSLMESMTPDQLERYEAYRRSRFPLSTMRAVASRIIASAHVTEHIQVALEGASKMFVGDIIETARANMDKAGLTGPILPEAIREAYRQLIQEGKVPHVRPQRRRLR